MDIDLGGDRSTFASDLARRRVVRLFRGEDVVLDEPEEQESCLEDEDISPE